MLVPLMFLPELEATSKTSEPQPETRLKPQLHTQKNHNSYNGTRTLPIATRVRRQQRPIPDSDSEAQTTDKQERKPKHRSKSREPEDESPLYEITLYYPHNRACTIYRSRQDFLLLRTGFTSRSSSTAPQPLSTPRSGRMIDGENDHTSDGEKVSKAAAKWDKLLRAAVESFAKYGHGRHSVEWFLRRRLGDCERVACGNGTGLPAGTTRRIKVKQPRGLDDRKITDERSEKQEDKVGNTDKSDGEAATTEGKCLHDTNEDEAEDNITKQSRADNENDIDKSHSPKDEEMHKGKRSDGGRDEIDNDADDGPEAARPKARLFTEVLIGLDSVPVRPFKPIPDLGKLEGSSLTRRRKHKQSIEKTGHDVERKTLRNGCNVLQCTIEDCDGQHGRLVEPWETDGDARGGLDSMIGVDKREESLSSSSSSSSSDGTVVLTPTSANPGESETSPGDSPPNSALMYKLMFSRRASDSDWGQEILSLIERDDSSANTL